MKNNVSLITYDTMQKQINNLIINDYYQRLMLIARSLFKWNNLPNGIDEKWIEEYLYFGGKCVFFDDKTKGYMVAKVENRATYNNYDEPTKIRGYGTNYRSRELTNNVDCVIIRNNDDMIPTNKTIKIYAYKLANIDRAIDTNIELQKIPYVITCSEKEKISFKILMNKRKDNEPVIFGSDDLDIDKISVLNTDVPIVFDKLQVQKMNIWNECLTFLGINNANNDKRERLISSEVNANNEQIKACEDVMLKARQKACDLINEMFNLDISVERRSNININDLLEVLNGTTRTEVNDEE